jgi:hypothetical protein
MNIHTRQIKVHITDTLASQIDLSDVSDASKEAKLLTRGITVLAAKKCADVSTMEAIHAITDGQNDNGLDAIVANDAASQVYLFQSKWSDSGTKTIEVGDTHKFLEGCRDLLALRWDRFNAKVKAKQQGVEAILNRVSAKVVLVVVYTSTNKLPSDPQRLLDDFLAANNDGGEMVSLQTIGLAQLKAEALSPLVGQMNPCEATLFQWGKVSRPYEAVYGQVACSDVATWHAENGTKLFAANIRSFKGNTEVNNGIVQTLTESPESFWYMNNGITGTCDSIQRKPIGGNTNDSGVFVFNNLRIVNGAQTVGAIGFAAKQNSNQVSKARVLVRVVSKSESPIGFEDELTTKTNTQNRIDARDFVALDPTQTRLKSELLSKGIEYVFRDGDKSSQPGAIDVQEAAIALGCARTETSFSVYAKRNIGELLSRDSKQYQALFSDSLSGQQLLESVEKLRLVDRELLSLAQFLFGREQQLLVHGNRILAHIAINESSVWSHDSGGSLSISKDGIKFIFDVAIAYVEERHAEAYLAVLFKNTEKCEGLDEFVKRCLSRRKASPDLLTAHITFEELALLDGAIS